MLNINQNMCLSKNYTNSLKRFSDLVLGGMNASLNANPLIVRGNIYSITTFSHIGKLDADTHQVIAMCQASK